MNKKKLNSLSDLGGLVYSTGDTSSYQDEDENETLDPASQLLEVHLEKKGRGGKTAIIIKGFEGSEDELKKLGSDLKSHCATGGSVKDGEIIIQGNQREKIMDYLRKKGFGVKRVGA